MTGTSPPPVPGVGAAAAVTTTTPRSSAAARGLHAGHPAGVLPAEAEPVDELAAQFPPGRIPTPRVDTHPRGSVPAGVQSRFAPGSLRAGRPPAAVPVPASLTVPGPSRDGFAPGSIRVRRVTAPWAVGVIAVPGVPTCAPGSIVVRRAVAPRGRGAIPVPRVAVARGRGSIGVPKVSTRLVGSVAVPRPLTLPREGTIEVGSVTYRGAGAIDVSRVRPGLPEPASLTPAPSGTGTGPSERGAITLADGVVEAIASRAAVEVDDAGGVAASLLGRDLAVAGRGRRTALDSPPKVKAHVDGREVYLGMKLSVRYPAPVPTVADAVRRVVGQRVAEMAGLHVAETTITVQALVSEVPSRPRVR